MAGFLTEIRKIMYVCGDCVHPSADSAVLVECVTQQQVVQLAVKAMEYAKQRCAGTGGEVTIAVEDVFFLMRRNKVKLQRLLYQTNFRKAARRTSTRSGEDKDPAEVGGEGEEGRWRNSSVTSQLLTDMFGRDFYSAEEATQLQQEMMERHDSRTHGMGSAEYLTYVECRQVSFVKNMSRFHKWLDLESVISHRPAQDVMEVLAHLAYDTVRELVELSLLVKRDMERNRWKTISSQFVLPSSLPPASSHPHSPHRNPDRPTSPSVDNGSGASGSGTTVAVATALNRNSHSRKRKKSSAADSMAGSHDSTSDQTQDSVAGPDTSQNELGTEKSGRGIQPSHIREALRRLSVPSVPLLPLATHRCRPSPTQNTVCL